MNSLPFGGVVWDILNREHLMQTLINALQGKFMIMLLKFF